MNKTLATICILGLTAGSCTQKKTSATESTEQQQTELTMLVGTYTTGESKGIYSYRFNQETGESQALSLAEIGNPSYLIPSSDGKFVYAVSEFGEDRAAVNAFAFDRTKGTFRFLNSQKTLGADPCYLLTDGKHVVTANYSGGSISIFSIAKDGTLLPVDSVIAFKGNGADKVRQEKPHLHCVQISPEGNYLFANDLGTDQIHKFSIHPAANKNDLICQNDQNELNNENSLENQHKQKELNDQNSQKGLKDQKNLEVQKDLDNEKNMDDQKVQKELNDQKRAFIQKGSTAAFKLKPGSGPRHLTFSPNGHFAYIINELSGTVVAFSYNEGDLKEIQTIAADTVGGRGSADIHISPDGKFLYASNRLKADGIAIFSIDPASGQLTKAGYQLTGINPRNFIITPNGKYLLVACRDSNSIQVYKRDLSTGLLTNMNQDIKLDKPVCIKFIGNE